MAKRSLLLPMIDGVANLPFLRDRTDTTEALLSRARALAASPAGADWGDLPTALAALLRAYREEADLSPFGALAAQWDVERFLTNLGRLADEEARAPDILDESIDAPLIVTGLPRSGTSFLHALLAEDEGNQAVRCWQTIYPYPEPGRADRRQLRVEWQLRSFGILAPGLRSIHPLDAQSPQECTEITAHVFQSMRFDTPHRVPSYRAWLRAHGHRAAYRFHRRFLQHLQHQHGRRRWVLKCPDHVFALDALHEVYPDARIVFVHRDPRHILPSVANLTEVLRAPFAHRTDPIEIGRQVMDDWARGADLMVAAARRWPFTSPPPFHVHYRDVVSRPLDTVRRLYGHFGIRLDAAPAERIGRLAAARPNGGYGRNVYTPATFGLDEADIGCAFRAYIDWFDVGPHAVPAEMGGTPTWSPPARSRAPAAP